MHAAEETKPVNYEVARRDFKFYVFDWDDNVLHMPTRIYMERRDAPDAPWRPVAVSTALCPIVLADAEHYRFPSVGGRDAAFRDFNDPPAGGGTPSAFLRDTRAALDRVAAGETPGPSFETLRQTLREGRIFAIVTARGHAPATIRKAVEIFVDRVLTAAERAEMMANLRGYRWWLDRCTTFGTDAEERDYYFSNCRFAPVSYPALCARMARDAAFGSHYENARGLSRQHLAKKYAIADFVEHLAHLLERAGGLGQPVSVGFSDDDPGNVQAVADYVRAELARRFPLFKFVVYDTSDPSLRNGRKVMVAGRLT